MNSSPPKSRQTQSFSHSPSRSDVEGAGGYRRTTLHSAGHSIASTPNPSGPTTVLVQSPQPQIVQGSNCDCAGIAREIHALKLGLKEEGEMRHQLEMQMVGLKIEMKDERELRHQMQMMMVDLKNKIDQLNNRLSKSEESLSSVKSKFSPLLDRVHTIEITYPQKINEIALQVNALQKSDVYISELKSRCLNLERAVGDMMKGDRKSNQEANSMAAVKSQLMEQKLSDVAQAMSQLKLDQRALADLLQNPRKTGMSEDTKLLIDHRISEVQADIREKLRGSSQADNAKMDAKMQQLGLQIMQLREMLKRNAQLNERQKNQMKILLDGEVANDARKTKETLEALSRRLADYERRSKDDSAKMTDNIQSLHIRISEETSKAKDSLLDRHRAQADNIRGELERAIRHVQKETEGSIKWRTEMIQNTRQRFKSLERQIQNDMAKLRAQAKSAIEKSQEDMATVAKSSLVGSKELDIRMRELEGSCKEYARNELSTAMEDMVRKVQRDAADQRRRDAEDSRRDLERSMESLKRRLEELQRARENGMVVGAERIKAAEAKVRKAEEAVKRNEEKVRKAEQDLRKHESKVTKAEDELKRNLNKLNATENAIEKNKSKVMRAEAMLFDNEKKLKSTEIAIVKNQTELRRTEEKMKAHQSYIDEAKQKGNANEAAVRKAEDAIQKAKLDVIAYKQGMQTNSERLKALEAENKNKARELMEARDNLKTAVEKANKEAAEKLETTTAALGDSMKALLATGNGETEKKLDELKAENAALKAAHEAEIKAIKDTLDELTAKEEKDFKATNEDVSSLKECNTNLGEKVEGLEKEIKGLHMKHGDAAAVGLDRVEAAEKAVKELKDDLKTKLKQLEETHESHKASAVEDIGKLSLLETEHEKTKDAHKDLTAELEKVKYQANETAIRGYLNDLTTKVAENEKETKGKQSTRDGKVWSWWLDVVSAVEQKDTIHRQRALEDVTRKLCNSMDDLRQKTKMSTEGGIKLGEEVAKMVAKNAKSIADLEAKAKEVEIKSTTLGAQAVNGLQKELKEISQSTIDLKDAIAKNEIQINQLKTDAEDHQMGIEKNKDNIDSLKALRNASMSGAAQASEEQLMALQAADKKLQKSLDENRDKNKENMHMLVEVRHTAEEVKKGQALNKTGIEEVKEDHEALQKQMDANDRELAEIKAKLKLLVAKADENEETIIKMEKKRREAPKQPPGVDDSKLNLILVDLEKRFKKKIEKIKNQKFGLDENTRQLIANMLKTTNELVDQGNDTAGAVEEAVKRIAELEVLMHRMKSAGMIPEPTEEENEEKKEKDDD
ncbi:hypothetical protein AAMO2058_000256900 [Amorphochlora amoebiformis]